MVLNRFKQWRKNRQLRKWKEIDERNEKVAVMYEQQEHNKSSHRASHGDEFIKRMRNRAH